MKSNRSVLMILPFRKLYWRGLQNSLGKPVKRMLDQSEQAKSMITFKYRITKYLSIFGHETLEQNKISLSNPCQN